MRDKMNDIKISVIVPVYNVEDYLTDCLDSIANQTMINDIEVIMIDDGSSDNSRYIIEKYALDYDNFYAYHKENEGQGITRNYGLNVAKGEYIHFMDSDDYITPDAYETLYNLVENNTDIVVGNFIRFSKYNIFESQLSKNSFKNINQNIKNIEMKEVPELVWDTSTSNKLYSKKFLENNNIQFPNKKIYYEDLFLSFKTYYLAKSISISPKEFYYWRARDNKTSTTQQIDDVKNIIDRFSILNLVQNFIEENDVEDNIKNELYLKWLNLDLCMFIKEINNYPEDDIEEIIDEANKILNVIPNELFEELNTYKRILLKLTKDKDIERLLSFAPIEEELMENPELNDDYYLEYINFKEDYLKEEFNCKLLVDSPTIEENNLLLKFNEKISYRPKNEEHKIFAKLLDLEDEYDIECLKQEEEIYQLSVPIDLIKNKYTKIKIIYESESVEKNTYLKNKKRQFIKYEEFDITLGIEKERELYLNYREKNNNDIIINEIKFENGKIKMEGESEEKIEDMIIENFVSLERINYPIDYGDENTFSFSINTNDLLNTPIQRWYLKTSSTFNSIKLDKKIKLFDGRKIIEFTNSRSMIAILISYWNSKILNELAEESEDERILGKELKKENNKLEKQNKRLETKNQNLKNRNKELKNRIEEYKNRKVVKIADKIKM